MDDLRGRRLLITGGAGGIGRATVLALAAAGVDALIGDVDVRGADATAAAARDLGVQADVRRCDVGDEADVRGLVAEGVDRGGIDLVVGNAGVLRTAPLAEFGVELFQRHLTVNLTANFLLARAAAPALRDSPAGAIVFNASLGGLRGQRGSAGYNASKGGVVTLTKSLADELAPQVRVNCVCPGWIDTPFNDPFWASAAPEARDRIMGGIPLGRQGRAEEVASAIVFLLGSAASYITGHALVIDGGRSVV